MPFTDYMQGEVVYLYAFDVANEIALANVREILSSESYRHEVRTDHTAPKDVPLHKPLTFAPPQTSERMLGQPLRIVVRVFEVGVVNIAMHVPFNVTALEELLPYHQAALESGRPRDQLARDLCADVCASLRESMIRGSAPSEPEAYTIFLCKDLDGERDAGKWLLENRRAAAGLLSEVRPERLSGSQIEESLRIQRSFETSDLVVIDWDASLVIDLDGSAEDVLYVLELANLQLEEFRVMDRRLDDQIDRAYDDLERPRSVIGIPNRTHERLRRFRVDATKLADEVTHITKFLGDWHLARIYLGAQERFHLKQWQESVEKRLGQLDQVYQVIQSEVHERRMLWLEIAIVVLFIVDLLALFFWKA